MIFIDGIHLITNGEIEELHNFAQLIGLKREWFQSKSHLHYDVITISKLKLALKFGAIPTRPKDIVLLLKNQKHKYTIVTFDDMILYRDSVPTLAKMRKRFKRN